MAQINKPTDYFNTVLYTGNGSNGHAITGVGFQPDLVWGKSRSGATDHYWVDAVRGATKVLRSNFNGAEYTQVDSLVSFDTDGFTLDDDNSGGPSGNFNTNTATYASWNWLAGGTASSNTDGSITSSVSANTTSGFSIVSYTGNGSLSTVGHGLSSAPEFMAFKVRSTSSSWINYHKDMTATSYMFFDSTSGAITNSVVFNNTEPTSNVFTINTGSGVNSSGETYIAYCFHSVKGFSKFGSYTGNGSTDGTFVYTGFKPAFVIGKRTDTTGNWFVFDNKRDAENPTNLYLLPDSSAAEFTGSSASVLWDFLSNGFKIRSTGSGNNASGGTYIYMAFAESPLVGTNNIPATAR